MWLLQGWFYDTNTKLLQQHPDPKFNDDSYFIQLKCNLYGCKWAACNWYQHLNNGILFEGSYHIRHYCIIVLYTDDTLIFASDYSTIDSDSKHLGRSRICLWLPRYSHLQLILKDVGIISCSHVKYTPSDSILYSVMSKTPREDSWNCRSVIGKLKFWLKTPGQILVCCTSMCMILHKTDQASWNRSQLHCNVFTPHQKQRLNTSTNKNIHLQHVCRCWFCWHVTSRALCPSTKCALQNLLHNHILQVSHPMVIQTRNQNCLKLHREQIHCSFYGDKRIITTTSHTAGNYTT